MIKKKFYGSVDFLLYVCYVLLLVIIFCYFMLRRGTYFMTNVTMHDKTSLSYRVKTYGYKELLNLFPPYIG